MSEATSVKLVIPSQVQLVDLVHSASEKMAEVAGFDPDESLNLGLAVRETLVNAITHGNRGDPARNDPPLCEPVPGAVRGAGSANAPSIAIGT